MGTTERENTCESRTSEARTTIAPRLARSRFFAKWFAAMGFVGGGAIVFYIGFRAFRPPPPPPGTGLCGNAVLGGLLLMVFGTPLAAIASALVAAFIGGVLDRILHCCRQTRSDSEPTPPAR
jgi:hypothetical protein